MAQIVGAAWMRERATGGPKDPGDGGPQDPPAPGPQDPVPGPQDPGSGPKAPAPAPAPESPQPESPIVDKGGSHSKTPMSGDDWHRYFNGKYGTNNVTWDSASINDIIEMPSRITDFTPEQVVDLARKSGWSVEPLGKGSLKGIPYEQGGGLSMHAPNGSSLYIQYHPGGGHHGKMPYYKVSTGQYGIKRFFIN